MKKRRQKSTKPERFSADGVEGCLLKVGPFGKRKESEFVFRIYTEDCSSFKDYRITAADVFVKIKRPSGLEFIEDEHGKRLDYNLRGLGLERKI